MDVHVGKRVKHERIDSLINQIRFLGLTYLMDKDFAKLSYEQMDIESKKLAVELKTLSGRLLSIAFDENRLYGGCDEQTANSR